MTNKELTSVKFLKDGKLQSLLSEYSDCFLVVMYDLEGNLVYASQINNDRDNIALKHGADIVLDEVFAPELEYEEDGQ